MPIVANRIQLLQVLQGHASDIIAFGVLKLDVFARDTATPDSDVDLFIEFVPERKTLKSLLGLSQYLQALLGRKVELVTPASLNPFTGKYILEAVTYVPLAA